MRDKDFLPRPLLQAPKCSKGYSHHYIRTLTECHGPLKLCTLRHCLASAGEKDPLFIPLAQVEESMQWSWQNGAINNDVKKVSCARRGEKKVGGATRWPLVKKP